MIQQFKRAHALLKANLSVQGDFFVSKHPCFCRTNRDEISQLSAIQFWEWGSKNQIFVNSNYLTPYPESCSTPNITYKMRYHKVYVLCRHSEGSKARGQKLRQFLLTKKMLIPLLPQQITSCELYSVSFLKRTSVETFDKLTPNARNIISSVIAKKSEGINKFHRVLN